jgi:hypothetical protein
MPDTPDNERNSHAERMEAVLDRISPYVIFANARRICKREFQRSPNWVLASQLFGLGSTYAYGMCRRIGVDPEGRTAIRKAEPRP